jgi:type IV pilus modification protein PilV
MRSNAGFSLLEVMCAILVLGIGLAGLTQGLSTALVSSKESEIQTQACLIASGLIEQLRAEESLVNGETNGKCGNGLPTCQWRQSVAASEIEGLHAVTVTIEETKSGKTVYELRTMLFEAPYLSDLDSSSKKTDSKRGEDKKKRGRQ